MADNRTQKLVRLKRVGLLNPRPETVRDALFLEDSAFFDAHDLLQVRYELLRKHLVDGYKIVRLCERYGISRQTFYNLLEKFLQQGTAGLLPAKPGPKGASKLTPDILMFVQQELHENETLSGAGLALRIEAEFGTSVHKRTIEKILRDIRLKKNF